MENGLLNVLTSIGLTDKEAKVYLACIETGSAPVSTIASAAKINRVTTYDILEKLKHKGLVSHFTKQKIKYFNNTDPEIVLEEFERKTNDLRLALPKFQRLTGETSHPRVRYFEGLEGIKAIYSDTLTSTTEILNFSNSFEIRRLWPKYDEEYVKKRAEKKIFLRGICPRDNEGLLVKSEDKTYFREFRLFNQEHFDFTNEVNIYDDKVSIISFKNEVIGMIIESHEIANSQRAVFNLCWQFAELMETHSEAKTKLLKPLSDKEVRKSIEDAAENTHQGLKESKLPEIKKNLKDNLSLF